MVFFEPIPWIEIELLIDEFSKMEEFVNYGRYLAFGHQIGHRIVA